MGRALSIIGVPTSAANFTAALEGLTSLNEQLLRAAPDTPPLYAAGVRYTKIGSNKWRNVNDVLASGDGDCEGLAPWRAAELRVTGEDPGASVMAYKTGARKYHAVVLRGDGQIEDPSIALGMKAPPGLLDTYQTWNNAVLTSRMGDPDGGAGDVAVMGCDAGDVACVGIGPDHEEGADQLSFLTEEGRHGHKRAWKGHARLPLGDGRALYAMTSPSSSPQEAEAKASAVIGLVGSLWDDVQALVAPFPQAAAALRIARNTHVQNIAKAAYNAVRGRKSSSSAASSGQPYRETPAAALSSTANPTQGNWMPPMGAPTGADLSDPSFYSDMDAGGSPSFGPADADAWASMTAPGYIPQGGGYRNDDTYQQLMAAKEQDDFDAGVYGFGPTPSEQWCMDQVNGVLAAGSRPSVGATFVQRGGAGFRSVKVAAPLSESVNSQLNSGLPAVNPGTGWTSAAAQLGLPTVPSAPAAGSGWMPTGFTAAAAPGGTGMTAYSGPIYSSALGTTLPAGTTPAMARVLLAQQAAAAAPPPGYYPNYYPQYSGGGVSSTGTPYGAAAASSYDPTPGGYAASSSYDDYGPSGGYTDADAFFGSNPSGMTQEEKADQLAAYGYSGDPTSSYGGYAPAPAAVPNDGRQHH